MNEKGFTLIELLAVIVVLAIIALITIPQILNVVDKSQRSAFIDSAYGIIEAGKLYYMENINGKNPLERYDFEIINDKFVLEKDSTKELKFNGTVPDNGILQLHSNGRIAIAICNKEYCACKGASELKVTLKEANCNINDETGDIENVGDETLIKSGNLPGTVISYMGTNPPEGYLACDGKTYNISEYNTLAENIKKEFGNYNYFGGDGKKTFGVPDLRGEFLRGAGTADRDTGTGEDVGIHQDPTNVPYIFTHTDGTVFSKRNSSGETAALINADKYISSQNAYSTLLAPSVNVYQDPESIVSATVRPTNTSVLYCIKY